MRRWAFAGLLIFAISSLAWAQEPAPDGNAAAVQRVITDQIEAFRRDDGQAAFALASPGIQRQFGDAAHFLAAVRMAYAAVYRPRSFSFGAMASQDGLVLQKLEVVGPNGVPVTALYELEREADGTWRISGCRLLKSALQEA